MYTYNINLKQRQRYTHKTPIYYEYLVLKIIMKSLCYTVNRFQSLRCYYKRILIALSHVQMSIKDMAISCPGLFSHINMYVKKSLNKHCLICSTSWLIKIGMPTNTTQLVRMIFYHVNGILNPKSWQILPDLSQFCQTIT